MATSEHVIMQNEALVALALIAALELGKYLAGKLFLLLFLSWMKGSTGMELKSNRTLAIEVFC